jgi:hypothetical protein
MTRVPIEKATQNREQRGEALRFVDHQPSMLAQHELWIRRQPIEIARTLQVKAFESGKR